MRTNDQMHGFTVQRTVELKEIHATLVQMVHDRTGLELVWLDREDENKTFGIAFTTLPWNDTGVFHIIEHSVLCGSDRYPVKEPFLELMKNSMNTFLNAFTYPDKTVYPISSTNDKDYMNLVRVYLDAVFHPAIYHKPEIFRQEGWHYEFDENGKPSYKGVVFNEMKGAFADSEEITMNELNRALFPDNAYRFCSGGDPASIPDLSYEDFLAAHQKFYSPSNAYVFVDGSVPIDGLLACMNDEFLKDFEKSARIAPAPMQQPVKGGTRTATYEIGADEEEEGKMKLTYGYVIGTFDEREKRTAADILSDVLTGSNTAPLKKAILEKELAEDVDVEIMGDAEQPVLMISVRNFRKEKQKEIEDTLSATLKNLSEKGLDHAQIEASMANYEFRMRERDFGSFPTGLVYGLTVLESWQYGGLPEANVEVGDLFVRLKEKLNDGYFEKLICELILNNPHSAEVVLVPSKEEGEKRRKAEEARLSSESSSWSPEQKKKLIEAQKSLETWQHHPDTPEQLATLPHLKLSDIDKTPKKYFAEVTDVNGCEVIRHNENANGILYVTADFNAADTSPEELPYLSFLCTLIGELKTRTRSSEDVQRIGRLVCGGFSVGAGVHEKWDGSEVRTFVSAAFSALETKAEEAGKYAADLLRNTLLEEENVAHNLLRQCRQDMFERIVMSGNGIARTRVAAQFYSADVIDDKLHGIDFYQWAKHEDENWNWNHLVSVLTRLADRIFVRSRLRLSVTGNADKLAPVLVNCFASVLKEGGKAGDAKIPAPSGKQNEGIVIPADIAFAVKGGDYRKYIAYRGDMKLASRILQLQYLWNVIRVQGGAYGTGIQVRLNGFAACHSYRDPNGDQSLEKYNGCGKFLADFLAGKPDLTGFIIGAVSDASPLTTPRTRGSIADSLYYQGVSYEMQCRFRQEMLEATCESLQSYAEAFTSVMTDGGVCMIAGQNQIEKCKFDKIINL